MHKHHQILKEAKKIAVVRTDRLGDMVLTLPLCRAIKENYPCIKLTVIANSYTEPLLLNSPVVDNYFFTDTFKNGINEIFTGNKYDAVFFPRPQLSESLAAFKAKIPLRIGSGYRVYSLLFNHKVYEHRKDALRHEAEYNTRILTSVTGLEYDTKLVMPFVDEKDISTIAKLLITYNVGDKFLIVHPGSGGSAYDWSAENFGKAAKIISERTGNKIVITGTNQEKDKCSIVKTLCPDAVNLCGELNLKQLIALISKTQLLLANSTGILHIAAALDKNVIGLYPNTPHISHKRWGPYSDKAIVINPPQSRYKKICDNMSLIKVEEVAEAAIRILS